MTGAVWVAGARIDLGGIDPLATGGEAAVYVAGGRALKVWHAPSPSRVKKLLALLSHRLPDVVVAPEAAIESAPGGDVIGFAMPLLAATFEPIAVLGSAAHRASRGISTRLALAALGRLAEALGALHAAGIVVGDLSDQNVVVDLSDARPVRLLDVDSFQIDGLPCEVSTEAFLDPLLYGPDVAHPCATATGAPRAFSPESDGYAFAVLCFRALSGAHPYGGALDALPTLPRRAAARASILRDDVRRPPRVTEALAVLDPPVRALFEATFERGERGFLDAATLDRCASSFVVCGCGLELPASRLPCPRCARAVAVVPLAAGRLRDAVVLEAAGPIVAVSAAHDAVFAVAIEQGLPLLYVARGGRLERHAITNDAAPAGWDVALDGPIVMVAARGADPVARVVAAMWMRCGLVTDQTATERARGAAAIAVACDAHFRIARGTVLACRATPRGVIERPVATVVAGSARLWGAKVEGAPAAIVLGTALGRLRWELVTERRAVALDAPELSPGETLREVVGYGDGSAVVVLARTKLAGRALVRSCSFDGTGRRTTSRLVPEDLRAADSVIGGGAVRGDAVVLATSRGLVREDAAGTEKTFADAAVFTAPGAPVALAPGAVLLADGRLVRRLELR